MAQKTEKEETEFKVVIETIMLCVKCGITGNSAANDSCKTCLSAIAAGSTSSVVVVAAESKKSFRSSSSSRSSPERKLKPVETSNDLKKEDSDSANAVPVKREVNRCSSCRRKLV
ncbi:zinc finger A20 and AN1 domain-containing stress-associated protein 5-like [Forsythia ovata]|uniref:Zinc finger A20 and AN1 domain-containing stress-associated protein 5-like n=1 Tax=Forsythia ovata TaxID=205694 RepID=A0ABD1VJV9_9LAMI